MRLAGGLVCLLAVLFTTACMDLTHLGGDPLHRTVQRDESRHKLKGHVFAMRGLLGIFSTGMDTIAERADKDLGVPAVSVAHSRKNNLTQFIIQQHRAKKIQDPIVLVGHSLGADDEIKVARSLNKVGIPVELMVLVDPVNPQEIPPNVKRIVNIYMPHVLDGIPVLRGVPVSVTDASKTQIENIDLSKVQVDFNPNNINHFNIDEIPGVQEMVIQEIHKTLSSIQSTTTEPQQLSLFKRVARFFGWA